MAEIKCLVNNGWGSVCNKPAEYQFMGTMYCKDHVAEAQREAKK